MQPTISLPHPVRQRRRSAVQPRRLIVPVGQLLPQGRFDNGVLRIPCEVVLLVRIGIEVEQANPLSSRFIRKNTAIRQ